MYCKKCGMEVDSNAKFCSNCGEKIENIAKRDQSLQGFSIEEENLQKEKDIEKEKLKKDFHIDNFDWNLDGYPAAQNKKTEDADFNWSSVLENKKRDTTYEDPISFEALNLTPKKEQNSEEHQSNQSKQIDDEEIEETEEPKQDDNIMELSFEDEIFGDIRNEKPATATIRIDQTIHFTDQLYSFNNKQAEFQSVLDEEYEKLKNEDEDTEEGIKTNIEDILGVQESSGHENNISSDDFLKELYSANDENSESEDKSEEELNGKVLVSSENNNEAVIDEVSDLQEEDRAKEKNESGEESGFDDVITLEDEEKSEETDEAHEQTLSNQRSDDSGKEYTETEEGNEIETLSEDIDEASYITSDSELEFIGVALARTPRGVLVIEKNNKEKLSKMPISPSRENKVNETKKESKPEEIDEKKGKLSFGDVFNSDDDDSTNDDYKSKKKGRFLKVVAVILCIFLIIELVLIGIQYFAPDTELAHKINSTYSRVISHLLPEKKGSEVDSGDAIVKSQLADYISAEAGKYESIAEIYDNPNLKFGEQVDYELDGYDTAGTFTDSQWYTDDNGKGVTYGESLINGVVQYYASLMDYKNGKNEEIINLLSENSELKHKIADIDVKKDVSYAINSLEIGEVKSSEKGIYVIVKIKFTDSESESETVETQIVFLKPENMAMKIDNIISI